MITTVPNSQLPGDSTSQININLISLSDSNMLRCRRRSNHDIHNRWCNLIFAEWSNGFIGTTITDLAPDTYSVTVTDNNDRQETATYVIHEGGVVVVTLQQQQNVTCNGGNNGSLSVLAAGGEAPYTYSCSTEEAELPLQILLQAITW